ncbi:MAG: AsmA family protein [Proteobacteria bacterium]|nr:AsmA family protein [Pseudomonadota bacterium]
MKQASKWHRRRVWAIRALGGAAALVALLLATLLLTQSHLKDPIVRYVASHSQREIRVEGALRANFFSLHPSIVADGVTIGNPSWMPPGVTAQIGHIELTFGLPPKYPLQTVVIDEATLHLSRLKNGSSNWQALPPGSRSGTGPPLIRSLHMPKARVIYDDARRHLRFEGTITAQDLQGGGTLPPLRIDGAGQLNGRPTNFALNCDPLASASRDRPYRFDFMQASSETLLTGRGEVPRPFDFHSLDLRFEATGHDMKDLYFLTGLGLPNTGDYHLTGRFNRQNLHLEFTDLQARSGESDMHGTVVVEAQRDGATSHTHADLKSKRLRTADLGARAAGRGIAGNDHTVLPDTPFNLNGARHTIADVDFHAETLELGRTPVRDLAMKVKIDLGAIEVAPLSGVVRDGKVTGRIRIDVTRDIARADVDFKVAHLKLAMTDGKASPVEGPLQARLSMHGKGNSLHDLAANADGKLTAVLPHGAIRSSLAELSGFDLRGLGLMATGNEQDTGIRCALASFDLEDGTLKAQRLLVDTDPVLITGQGSISLDSEALDLKLIGRPKHPRLRIRAPLLVRGTLRHPAFSIEAKKPIAQAGGAVALGVLLTPVAAMLAFVDPGLAKDSDCGALLAETPEGKK